MENMSIPEQPCGHCGHAFAKHDKDVRDTGQVRSDYPISSPREGAIYSSREAGTSGCTEPGCECCQWREKRVA
jgi:hypothetical protein